MKNKVATLKKMTPAHDPWEAYLDVQEHGKMTLSSIEFYDNVPMQYAL